MKQPKPPPGLYRRGTVWWARYSVNGQVVRESTGSAKLTEARRFLDGRKGAAATGALVMPRLDRIPYLELSADLTRFYRTTGKRQLDEVEDRLVYLDRCFRGYRAASITPDRITAYVAERQAATPRPANRTINIELSLLKRMLRLACRNNKLMRVPPIDMLKDAPARSGFFEPHQYEAVRRRLPDDLQAAIAIAYTFGWRKAEVLSLERRQLDLRVGTLRLDASASKNGEGRIVYLTPELRQLLGEQVERVDTLSRRLGRIVPALFPHFRGRWAGNPRQGFERRCAGTAPAGKLACRDGWFTIFAGRRCGTLSAPASRGRWR